MNNEKHWLHRLIVSCLGLAAAALTVMFLCWVVQYIGSPAQKGSGEKINFSVGEKYDMFINNRISDALDGVLSVDKVYWIGKDELVAPKPNPNGYGEAESPEELIKVLNAAEKLLDGERFYFSPDIKIIPGTKITYYLDDTILAIAWKEQRDGGVYSFAEIKIAHPSQFRRFLATGEFGSDKLFYTTEMAESVNAVVASAGDFYRFRNAGILVYDGEVKRVANYQMDVCYITNEGDMMFSTVNEPMDMEQAQKFVDDNDISFSLAFGPIMIRDGKNITPKSYGFGQIDEEYPRSALMQMGKLHYMLATANAEGWREYVPNLNYFAINLKSTGCIHAYTLDGGQTATLCMNNKLVNRVLYNTQRKISDIIYFATAIPDGG